MNTVNSPDSGNRRLYAVDLNRLRVSPFIRDLQIDEKRGLICEARQMPEQYFVAQIQPKEFIFIGLIVINGKIFNNKFSNSFLGVLGC